MLRSNSLNAPAPAHTDHTCEPEYKRESFAFPIGEAGGRGFFGFLWATLPKHTYPFF